MTVHEEYGDSHISQTGGEVTHEYLPSGNMATITETREVCDVCGNPRRKVRMYRVGYDGHLVKVALCVTEHAKPLEKLLAVGTPITSSSPKVRVFTMEEIERMKKAKK